MSAVITGMAGSLDTSGRNAVVGIGAAIVRGFYKPVSSATPTAIPAASSQNRIDRLVLRLNRAATAGASFVVPTVITGTPAASPVEPALTQTPTGLWDLPICSWTSTAAGALTKLMDERYNVSLILSGLSTARPVMPAPGLLLETDTGMTAVWNGSLWQYITTTPDSWKYPSLSPGGWSAAAGFPSMRYRFLAVPQAVVQLEGYLNVGTVGNLTLFNIPAPYYRADKSLAIPAVCTATSGGAASQETPYITIGTGGQVSTNAVPSGAQTIMFNGTYSLDS